MTTDPENQKNSYRTEKQILLGLAVILGTSAIASISVLVAAWDIYQLRLALYIVLRSCALGVIMVITSYWYISRLRPTKEIKAPEMYQSILKTGEKIFIKVTIVAIASMFIVSIFVADKIISRCIFSPVLPNCEAGKGVPIQKRSMFGIYLEMMK